VVRREAGSYHPPVPILPYLEARPRFGARSYLAETAWVTGDVAAGDDVSFWFNTAARGDVNWIRIGDRTNVQDGAVLHVSHETHPLEIGDDVVVGHSAVLHGCTVEDRVLVGIGARVLDGAVLESECQVGAGALVPPGMTVPAGHLVLGVPARVVRPLASAERANIREIAERYVRLKETYRKMAPETAKP
jgi:carbonic anhydrase/acetyltransferase-like protein (isoleucine patch superfamily)